MSGEGVDELEGKEGGGVGGHSVSILSERGWYSVTAVIARGVTQFLVMEMRDGGGVGRGSNHT